MKEKLLKGLKWFYRSYIWLGVLLFAIDIITKQLIMHSGLQVGVRESHYSLLNGFVYISYVLNEGAAFGFGTGSELANRIIYLVVATLITAGITAYLVVKRKETKLIIRAALIMVITGAIGNMIDRVFYGPLQGENGLFSGKVVDWIDFHWFWPYVFNIADCCIVIAAFMLIIYIIVSEVKDYRERNKTKVKTANDHQKVLSKSEKEKLEAEKAEQEESK